jgi:hypothetical protein
MFYDQDKRFQTALNDNVSWQAHPAVTLWSQDSASSLHHTAVKRLPSNWPGSIIGTGERLLGF